MSSSVGGEWLLPGRLRRLRQEEINGCCKDVTERGQRLPHQKKYMIDGAS